MAKICEFCRTTDDDELMSGGWRTLENRNFHYFCLLFAEQVPQYVDENENISGFLMRDINNSLAMCRQQQCYLCGEKSAAVLCSEQNCERRFHVACGIDNLCQFQFIDEYKAYCNDHCTIADEHPPSELYECFVCHEAMGDYEPTTSFPGCSYCRRGWYHRRCLQQWATSRGHGLACPSCGNKDEGKRKEYRNFLRYRGIYIPDRDASWLSCHADDLKSKKGGKASDNKNVYSKFQTTKDVYDDREEVAEADSQDNLSVSH